MNSTFKINCVICNKKIIFNAKIDNISNLIKVECPVCDNIMYFEILEDWKNRKSFFNYLHLKLVML
jgi:transcription elongation factor Elf1